MRRVVDLAAMVADLIAQGAPLFRRHALAVRLASILAFGAAPPSLPLARLATAFLLLAAKLLALRAAFLELTPSTTRPGWPGLRKDAGRPQQGQQQQREGD